MKSVCRLAYTPEDFILFAWIILSDKFFGFTVEVTNFYKLKIDHLEKEGSHQPGSIDINNKNDKGSSIVELPRVHYPAEKEYITFGQMMWILTKGNSTVKKWQDQYRNQTLKVEDMTSLLPKLSHIFHRTSLLRSCKMSVLQYFNYMKNFYSSLFDQVLIKNFWNSSSSSFFIEPFLFEHAKINELQHDSDGVVNSIKTHFILKFNYDKFHRHFNVSHEKMVDSLLPLLFTKQTKSLIVNYLNSFVHVLKLLTLPHEIIRKNKDNKRIGDVDKVMDLIDARQAVDNKDLDPGAKLEKKDRSEQDDNLGIPLAGSKDKIKNNFSLEALFEKNFREVNRLVKNEFGGEVNDQGVLLNTNMDRIRAGKVIVSNKEDIAFSFDKMVKKKKPIMIKAQVTENLEEAVKYNIQLTSFENNLRSLPFDFSIDIAQLFSAIQEKHFDGFTRNHEDYDLIYRVDIKHQAFGKNDPFAERNIFLLKIKFRYETIPFERYDNFVKIASIEIRLYYPHLHSFAFLVFKEPCFIIKFLRILSLSSDYLRNIELSALLGHLLSHHHPKNTFTNIDVAINASYLRDEKHFYMTVLRVCDERNLSMPLSRQTKVNVTTLKQVRSLGKPNLMFSRNSLSPNFSPKALYSQSQKQNSQFSITMEQRELTDEASREAITSRNNLDNQPEEYSKLQELVGMASIIDPKAFKIAKRPCPMIRLQPVNSNTDLKPSLNSVSDVKEMSWAMNSPLNADRVDKSTSGKIGFGEEASKIMEKLPKKKKFNFQRWNLPKKLDVLLPEEDQNSSSEEEDQIFRSNYDPDGVAFLRQNVTVNSEQAARREYERMNNYLENEDDAKITVKKPDEKIMPLESTKVIQNLDENLKVIRISFKMHDTKEGTPTYRFTENTEGFLNTTLQKQINSMKPHVQELSDLPQEKVKERLLINDSTSKNCLEGIQGTKKEIFSFIQNVQGLGKCHLKVFSFYSKVDYTKKTIVVDTEKRSNYQHYDPTLDLIGTENLYEGLCYRFKSLAMTLADNDPFTSLREFSDDFPRVKGSSPMDEGDNESPFFPIISVKEPDEEFKFSGTFGGENTRQVSPLMTATFGNHGIKPTNFLQKSLRRNPSFNFGLALGSGSKLEDSNQSATSKLFRKEEILLLNINIVPINFKHREYKIILNSQDINNLVDLKKFFYFCLKTTSGIDLEYKLGIVHPKLMFVNLLRYLVSKIEMSKDVFYRQPTFKKESKDNLLLMNVFNKYEHNTNIILTSFLDKVSNNKIILYSGVKRCNNTYFIVTVMLNVVMNSVTFKVYNPSMTRTYMFEASADKLVFLAEEYFNRFIFPLFLNDTLKASLKSYQDFTRNIEVTLSPKHKAFKGEFEFNDEIDIQDVDEEREIDRNIERDDLDLSHHIDDMTLLGMNFDDNEHSQESSQQGGFAGHAKLAVKTKRRMHHARKKTKSVNFMDSYTELSFPEKFAKLYEMMDDPCLIRLFVSWDRQMTNGKLRST
jgi:hypothetical protein